MAGIGEMINPWLLIKLKGMTAKNVYSCRFISTGRGGWTEFYQEGIRKIESHEGLSVAVHHHTCYS